MIFSYPDLAISDYESDVVYLFKTKPTIRVKAWFPDLKTDTPIGGPEGGIQRYFGCGNEKCWKLCLRYEGVDHTGSSLWDFFEIFLLGVFGKPFSWEMTDKNIWWDFQRCSRKHNIQHRIVAWFRAGSRKQKTNMSRSCILFRRFNNQDKYFKGIDSNWIIFRFEHVMRSLGTRSASHLNHK